MDGEPNPARARAFGARRTPAGGRRGAPLRDFERLYDAHAGPLLAFLIYRTGDRGLSEDLLADTFERVLRTKRRFDARRGSEKTWLYAIALNCLRDHARRQTVERRVLERSGAPDDGWQAADTEGVHDRDLLRRSLKLLSDEERLVVSLRYGADLTMPEIAKVLREPLTTVEARVYRALRRLRAELGPPDGIVARVPQG